MADRPAILYCRCAYAQVVPEDVKDGVLEQLCASGASFDSVSDLCEMSARRDERMKSLATGGPIRIAACHERAVRGLFHAAGSDLDESDAEIVNMREHDVETATRKLLRDD